MTINDILTATEASEMYGVAGTTLRERLDRGISFKHGVDCRKTSGKRGEWLVTREAMDRVYGNRLSR